MKKLFQVAGELPRSTVLTIELIGVLIIILAWFLVTMPLSSTELRFTSGNSQVPVYHWTGPNGFSKEFTGDNLLLKIKPGTYYVEVKDENNCVIKDSVTVPESITEPIQKQLTSNCANEAGSIVIDIEIKNNRDGMISRAILPTPTSVLLSYGDLFTKDKVLKEASFSFTINFLGYIEAIILSIIFGFLIALIPICRAAMKRWVNAIRFIPLTAVTGLFIAWFGIATNMKVQFLAFGIIVYLLPVVVQRIDEVEKLFIQTAYTLGASSWQQIRYVYFPHVAGKLIDDIRVLTAISWTYIIIAEMLNQTGGLGALIHLAGRQSRLDKVFALLLIIVIIGIIQDFIFVLLDKFLFPHKHVKK